MFSIIKRGFQLIILNKFAQ